MTGLAASAASGTTNLGLACGHLAGAILFFVMAVREIVMHRRWGQVPKTLTVTSNGLMLSWLGSFNMQHRRWSQRDLKSVRVTKATDLLTFKPIYRLKIVFAKKSPRSIVLSTGNRALTEEISAQLSPQPKPGGATGRFATILR